MERSKYIIALTLVLLGIGIARASYRHEVYNAYIRGDMAHWKKVIDEMQRQASKNDDFRLELLNYQYGYIGWCIGTDRKDEAGYYIGLGESHINALERSNHKPALVLAYKSAFYGYMIGLNIYKAPYLGPKSITNAQSAMKLDPQSPMGYVQYANANYYMPPAFGGSKSLALKDYKKALSLMESEKLSGDKDWNYLSLLLIIAQAHDDLGQYRDAHAYYAKILRIEPGFLWVKNELYPEIARKINQKI